MPKETQEKIRETYQELELQELKNRNMPADKTKSIKDSTDDELQRLLSRLRSEVRAQELVRSLKRNSMSDAERYNNDLEVSTEVPVENLYHYGVLGMKWGVRKGSKSSARSANESKDYKTSRKLKGKKISEMSNDELRTLNSRMQLERQYKDLNPSSTSKGRKIVSQILGTVGKEVATNIIRKQLTKQMERVMT